MYDAGDRKSIRAAEKLAKLRDTQDREAMIAIMSSRSGRAWMESKLAEAHIFHEEFTGNALREAFQKGQRNFGLALLADIHRFCPEEYLTMMRERNERDSRYRTESDTPDTTDGTPTAEYPGSEEPRRVVEGQPSAEYDIYRSEATG